MLKALRPQPPAHLTSIEGAMAGPLFEPAPELLRWAFSTFIEPDASLHNEDHLHLSAARLGMLWTNARNSRHGRRVIGQAEFKPPGGTMGKWQRARAQAQLYGWFAAYDLDFVLTFDAQYAAECSDAEFCALVEHELYHCGQAQDEFGPKFLKDSGLPVFTMRGHDVEEFIGVVKRYGAVSQEVAALVEVAADVPAISTDAIRNVCGTCHA